MSNLYPEEFDAIILGGGFAGVYAAQKLSRALRRSGSSASVALIAEENHMVFQPMLPEVAGAALSPRHVVNPIRSLCKGVNVFKGKVNSLQLDQKKLTLHAGDFAGPVTFTYRNLALCLGAKVDLSRIPGMQEHALLLQNVGDAMRIRAHFISRIEEANLTSNRATKRRLLSFVIVGGGYSGVETAGQLIDLAQAIHKHYKHVDWADFSFTLVHSRDHLLPTLHRSLGEYTAAQLKRRGLDIVLNRRAKAVTANTVYLDDGSGIDTNNIICTVGNAPHPLILNLEKTAPCPVSIERGRVVTLPDCSIDGIPWLWAAGDCASVPQTDGTPSPPTAQFALRQGELMGRNIARRLKDQETRPFTFKAIGELATIGHHSAVAEIKGLRFSGAFAWWMWRTIYLGKLPGLERKLRVLFDWTLELFFPRDINLLNPRYSTDISETHLEPGDTLFRAGDPSFSFYLVKKGAIDLRDKGQLVKKVGQHEHFGERALLENRPYLFDAVATEATTLVTIGKDIFQKIVSADSSFGQSLQQSARSYVSAEELDILLNRLPAEQLEQPVSEYMSAKLFSIEASATIEDALERFTQSSRNYLPVIEADGSCNGAINKESVYMRLLTSELDRQEPVSTLTQTKLPLLRKTASLREALTLMTRSNASKAIATDAENRPCGMIAIIDLLESIR
ncbi:FAD-dependent oxidoreductase [Pelagicoccus sp. SDUM812005]|uniref:FAD-dependent oxidoreductase n=1 Tax=Pelagicoccus sp. SDUM812005 TaxID=3041257 RepID=UPI0028104B28|nr:FAD-dependent oxidoreductase [Pelagicoccus sp. SDUM812005]MDQ8179606.1 FAD-dependent oxidoreductase [Pelagicoccus sp. SDUM812005]